MNDLLKRLLLTPLVAAAFPLFLHAQVMAKDAPACTLPAVAAESATPGAEIPEAAPALPAELPDAPNATGTLPDWPPASVDILKSFKSDYERPLTVGGKAQRAIKLMFIPGVFQAAALAGISMATDSSLERDYGQGAKGFVRRWGSDFGVTSTKLFIGDFALASALHIDPRYHPSKSKSIGARLGHAILHTFVTQTDSGKRTFNAPQVFGILCAAAASNGWHHVSDQGAGNTGKRIGGGLGGSVGFSIFQEFVVYHDAPRQ
jgi:hypothetical protein